VGTFNHSGDHRDYNTIYLFFGGYPFFFCIIPATSDPQISVESVLKMSLALCPPKLNCYGLLVRSHTE